MTGRGEGSGLAPGPWALPGAVAGDVVGRTREIELLLAGLDCGAHVVLEGPPGTGKTTLLRAIAGTSGVPFVFVEGNAELTPARLLGQFDPSQVLAKGYVPETFVDGPLIEALRVGGLLYVEEVNRVPEETLNVLVTVMSEGELHVPRLGRVRAADSFRLVAAMNPFDTVGTARISAAIYDRVCRIAMGYQAREEENDIVARRSPVVPERWRDQVVDLVRRTRDHPDVRVGSSVRGAIDLVRIAVSLARIRGGDPTAWQIGYDAAMVALSGRIGLRESSGRTAESIVADLYTAVFGAGPAPAGGTGGGAPGESRARNGRAQTRRDRAPPRKGAASRALNSRVTVGSPSSRPRWGFWTRTGSTPCFAIVRTRP
jgi:MoxR-like ATPase